MSPSQSVVSYNQNWVRSSLTCLDGPLCCEDELQQERKCASGTECVLIRGVAGRHAAHGARSFLTLAHLLTLALQQTIQCKWMDRLRHNEDCNKVRHKSSAYSKCMREALGVNNHTRGLQQNSSKSHMQRHDDTWHGAVSAHSLRKETGLSWT